MLTAGCLPAVRCGQLRLRAEEREEKLLLHSAQLRLSSTPCNGGNCLSTRGPLIRARSSVQCRMSNMRPSESLLLTLRFSHQFREPHFNTLLYTDTALMLDNCVFGYSRFKYQIKIESLLTNKWRINLLNRFKFWHIVALYQCFD